MTPIPNSRRKVDDQTLSRELNTMSNVFAVDLAGSSFVKKDEEKDPHWFFTEPSMWSIGTEIAGRNGVYMNETAVRCRAGILNFMVVVVWIFTWYHNQYNIILYLGPVVAWEMLSAATFGLTPLAPIGVVATILTAKLPQVWKPAAPKRFAWLLGVLMVTACIVIRQIVGPHFSIKIIIGVCYILTWMEAVMGICVGCKVYELIFIMSAYIPSETAKAKIQKATECRECSEGACEYRPRSNPTTRSTAARSSASGTRSDDAESIV